MAESVLTSYRIHEQRAEFAATRAFRRVERQAAKPTALDGNRQPAPVQQHIVEAAVEPSATAGVQDGQVRQGRSDGAAIAWRCAAKLQAR